MSPADDRARLSPGERALWLLHRLSPLSGAYNLAGAVRIPDLDAVALGRALRRLTARHAGLRTTFPASTDDGEPERRVHGVLEPALEPEVVALVEAESSGGDGLRQELEAESVRPFDPAVGPLVRVRIISLPAGERAVLFVLHHLIADFWSLALVLRELGALYGEETGGPAAELAPEPAPYAEWVEARERELAGDGGERLRAFWRERLAGPAPVLALPADRPRPAVASGAGHHRAARLGRAETARLLAAGRIGGERGATLFETLLAGFQLFLHRLTGDTEIWIGAPASGRGAARWAGTVGYFVNPVVLRGRPGEAASFAALVGAARAEARSALAHRGWPFPWLAAELQPVREGGRPPLFQAMLTVHRSRRAEEEALALLALGEGGGHARLGGLALETLPLHRRAAQLDLSLAAAVVDGELRLRLEMDADLFDEATAGRCAAQLATLLAAAGEAPDGAAEELPLLGAAERQQVLIEWGEGPIAVNSSRAEVSSPLGGGGLEQGEGQEGGDASGHKPSSSSVLPTGGAPLLTSPLSQPPPAQGGGTGETVLAWIAARAAAAPDAPAVLFEGRVVRSRGELARRVARLAATLRGLGAGPGRVVGLCLDRSPELVEAVLGILATGAAYLPLDPAYPRAYLEHAVADSGVALVLTRDGLRPVLPTTRGKVAVLPEAGAESAEGAGAPALPSIDPDAPAYLLYTSGSTGRPKGISITHRSLAAYIDWVLEGPLAGIDGLPFVTSLGFDASLKQLFAPLAAGFPVRLVDEETAHRPERLLAHLRGPGRLALNCVPSLWRAVLDALEGNQDGPAAPDGLRRLLLGGEGFDRALLERTFRRLPELEVWNLYGPTEATANAAAARLDPAAAGIPIGRPIRGARLRIVDPLLRPLPPGVPGELALGGTGLAPGYWRRPDLTAERFVPDPFSPEPGARLYRTGDRARFRPDGAVELLGRLDLQLKVRGLRIEPAEIEAALLAHPEVAECAVGVDAESGRLIAWVAPRSAAVTGGALHRHLEARLPAAMVPASFIPLAALPRTPAGKVDRAALAAMSSASVTPAASAAPGPRTPLEEVVAGLWAEVLEVGEVGPDDDFFARGGHSLLAARLLSRLRNALGVDLPLRALFAAPTVARLAAAVAAARREGGDEPVPPVGPAPRDERRFLSFAQERLWFLDQWMPDTPAYNIPAALRLSGGLDAAALAAALSEVTRRHESLRTTFTAIAGMPVQLFADPADAAAPLPVVDLAGLGAAARETAAGLAAAEARRPFDLWRGPLLRAALLRLGPAEHALVLNVHHIVSDGWSMGVLIGELRDLYTAFREGLPSPLPPLPLQVADFAAWQRRWVAGAAVARDLEWWRAFLAGAPAEIDLPVDRPRPAWSIHRGGLTPFRVGAALAGRLRALARHSGATLFMTLLAAFQALLGRMSGAVDLTVGSAVDQRTPEVEGLIGLFVNLLALRGDLSGDPPFADLLARTRRATLEAHDHRDLPFERLVAALEPVRHPGRNPLFQVAFSLLSAPLPEIALAGLDAEVTELETGTARFDLTLLLREAEGGVAGNLEHSADLFDAATVHRLLAGFETLLAGVAADPALPLSRLPLLAAAERRQILEEWGRSADRRPRGRSLGELFARQVERDPHAAAVLGGAGEEEITYGELDRRAAALARRLRALGVGPDVPVALCLERSPEMIVGILGIVQAGGAYVPLDLGYPRERLAFMLEDSGASIAVARGAALEALGASGLHVVDLDEALEAGDTGDGEPLPPLPPPAVGPDHLAYIVYTSGSTGRPKGVAATHRGVVRLVCDPGYVDLGPDETILQLAPVPFDASTFEIWGALLSGGRLAIPPPGPVALRELGEAIRRYRVTTIFLTTGLFHQMIDEETASLGGLRQLLTGGDVISVAHVRRALAALPTTRLIHAYGPTEATTFATCGTVTAAGAARATLSLGRPVPRTGVFVLDGDLEPVPPGMPGEIFLSGDGLARGYHRRPGLTAGRFIPHPFAAAPGERLYRTGDLARWLPDGSLDFLGRIDRQVKIRGFRVEPGEVEAVLESHPGVAAAAVLPRGEAEDKRLVAWVVPAAAPGPAAADLLAWCRERLPPFLVPAAFVPLAGLPLDANGKLDRNALPEPERGRSEQGFAAPRTPVERQVAAMWAEVLGLDRVGAEDDFFALGGHSLLATQIVSRVERDFGVEIGLRAFFEQPTVAGMAVAITREQLRQGDPERMARLLAHVRDLSPEELEDLLREDAP